MGTTQKNPTVQDLQNFIDETTVTFAHEVTKQKRKGLYITLKGNIQVWNDGEIAYQGMQPFQAIEVYNSI